MTLVEAPSALKSDFVREDEEKKWKIKQESISISPLFFYAPMDVILYKPEDGPLDTTPHTYRLPIVSILVCHVCLCV